MREYEGYPERFRTEAIAPIQNKVGAFLSNPILQRILCRAKPFINPREIMDQGKILVANLAKGRVGQDGASLLGALLLSQYAAAGLGRADQPEKKRRDHFLYLDEFSMFASPTLGAMLSELRKYRLNLILAHQHSSQLEPELIDSILGNVGTVIAFRVGLSDAEILEQQFYPYFSMADLINLPNYEICLKLAIDGVMAKPFSARTLIE